MSYPNALINYQAESIPEYLFLKWMTAPAMPSHRWECIDRRYNATHELWAHGFTKEIQFKPIRYLYEAFNSTHHIVKDTMTQTQRFESHDSTIAYVIPLILFFLYGLYLYRLFTKEDRPSNYTRVRARARSRSRPRFQ